jgi:7-cyano-7-deazaguanine synthase
MLYDLAKDQGDDVIALSFDYCQRHGQPELRQASIICTALRVPHAVVDLTSYGWLLSGSSSALTNRDVEVPEGSYDADNMKSTVVPNRNMTMISFAVGIAIANDAHYVATAVHAGDHAIYPDCRPEFISRLESAVRVGNDGFINSDFKILAPFLHKTKTDIAKRAGELKVPIDQTWSCYKGDMYHCGRCGTCVERMEALHDAGVDDPTIYLDNNFWKEARGR